MRIGLVIVNGLIVRLGTRSLKGSLPWIALGGVVALAFLAYRAQNKLWHADMLTKAQESLADHDGRLPQADSYC